MKRIILLSIAVLLMVTESCSKQHEEPKSSDDNNVTTEIPNQMLLKIGDKTLTVSLAKNSSVDALVDVLNNQAISIDMKDYGNMEKVGPLGHNLPQNDEQITAQPGDIILYQGNALVIYYAPNTWSFTRLGKIDNITTQELKSILGQGDVSVTLSLPTE